MKSRTVRVFLSSTFRDFAKERDLLVRKVFPELRRKCRARQVELVDVDLRWGITEEEAQQGKVLPICLAEIDRSRPFFMGFIGERYGWVPEAEKYDLSLIMEQPWLDEHRGGKSVTELEMLHGVLNNPAMEDRAFFYFRDAAYSNSKGGAYLSESEADKAKLEALKDRIRKSGYPVVENYPSPESLAERVKEDLWRLIDEAFPESEVPDALTQERMRHEQFAASRLGLYLGGEGYFAALDAAMTADPCRPVLVTGASGGGKSALLANWMERLSKQTPDAFVLFHFLAVGADASHPVGLATRLLKEISRFTGEELVLEGDPRKALHMLSTWLEKAGAFAKKNGKIFVLLVDALDKLSDTRNLDWWPRKLPDGVRLVVSCLDGEVLDAARTRMDWSEVKVSPLGRDDRSKLIEDYFGKYRKSLSAEQKALLLEHDLSGNPLFLRTLLEELRVFGVHEELRGRLAHYLACETIDDLFERVLERVEADNSPESVRSVLEVLWAAKESFAEDELLEVTGLPPAVWAPIHIALDESLIGAGGRLAFSHDYLRKAVQDRYLAEEKDRKSIRKKLSEFCASAMESGRKELSHYIRRHAVEHFLEVEDWDNATTALSDLEFIEARAIAQELPEMLKDYAEAVKLLPEGEKQRQTEAARQAELDRYAKEMYEYSARWSRIRDGSDEAEPTLPRPVESVRLWTEEEIAAERKRITETPNRLHIIKAFWKFVATNLRSLMNHAEQTGFTAMHACNSAPEGPVHSTGTRLLEDKSLLKIFRRFNKEEFFDPLNPCVGLLEGHVDWVVTLAMTPDGKRVISGSWDKTLRVWDVDSGVCLRILGNHTDWVNSIAMTPNGRFVISGSEDTLRVWDVESEECLKVLKSQPGCVLALFATLDGRRVISGSNDKTLRVWDIDSERCLNIIEGHEGPISAVAMASDGRYAVSGSNDKTLRLWDVKSGKCLNIFEGHEGPISAVAITPDARRIISGSWDQTLRVWDIHSGKCLSMLKCHEGPVYALAITADGRRVISGSSGILNVWNIESGECLRCLECHAGSVSAVATTADGCRVISADSGKNIRVWNVESGECLQTLKFDKNFVNALAITHDGQRVISGSEGILRIWDVKTSECLRLLECNAGSVDALVITPNGRRVISGSYGNMLHVWNVETGEVICVLDGHSGPVQAVAITPDGSQIVSGSNDNTIRVWDIDSGKCLRVLEGHTSLVKTLSVSPDGRRIISGSLGDTLRFWDINSGKCLHVLENLTIWVHSLAITPDGRRVISGNGENTLRVWDADSGKCLRVIEGHEDWVISLAITPDGRRVISGSEDKTLRVWDIESGKCISTMSFYSKVHSIVLSPERIMVANGSELWFASHESLICGPFITTTHREIQSEDLPAGSVTARPPCCGQLISIPAAIADRIKHWTHEGGEGGYSDPALLLDCPICSTPLRMNPFFVDIPIKTQN